MANLNMTVRTETRLCIVNGKVGYFHAWEHYSKPLPACPLVGGEPAGVLSQIFGIVEFEDGTRRVDPTEIIFCDEGPRSNLRNASTSHSRRTSRPYYHAQC